MECIKLDNIKPGSATDFLKIDLTIFGSNNF